MQSWILSYPQLRLFFDGMLCMMACYAIFSFFEHRKAIYWQYAFYIVCMMITFYLDDIDYQQADYKPGANFAVAFIESLAFLLYIRFAILLIEIPRLDPFSHRLLRIMTIVLCVEICIDLLFFLTPVSDDVKTTSYITFRSLLAIGALVVVPRILKLHQVAIGYFIAGSFFFVVGCLLALSINYIPFIFTKNSENPFSYPVTYMQFGVILEVLCFTLGMSVKNRQNEREKIDAQGQLIEQLQENEKKQIALQRIRDDISRDLHDELGADLSSISAMCHASIRQIKTNNPAAQDTITQVGETSRKVIRRMREIIWSLHSKHDSIDNFSFRVKETAYTLLEHQPMELHLDLPVDEIDLQIPNDSRRNLFLIYKEVLHNIVRHSKAKNVHVSISVEEGNLLLQVGDDGIGFAVGTDSKSGNGLVNLKQRAAALSGKLLIDSKPGAGTTVRVSCPIPDNMVSA